MCVYKISTNSIEDRKRSENKVDDDVKTMVSPVYMRSHFISISILNEIVSANVVTNLLSWMVEYLLRAFVPWKREQIFIVNLSRLKDKRRKTKAKLLQNRSILQFFFIFFSTLACLISTWISLMASTFLRFCYPVFYVRWCGVQSTYP